MFTRHEWISKKALELLSQNEEQSANLSKTMNWLLLENRRGSAFQSLHDNMWNTRAPRGAIDTIDEPLGKT